MIEILYEDKHAVAFIKPCGILSEPSEAEKESVGGVLCAERGYAELFPVHRLDRNVSGVMIMAKSKLFAGKLSALISERRLGKEYFAIVHGALEKKSGIYKDLLFKDSSKNKTFTVDKMRKGVKEASLEYRVLAERETEDGALSLVRVRLHTGRTHQIRVQFSSRGNPLFGDGKYGSHTNRGVIGLFSARIFFTHPLRNRTEVDLRATPDTGVYPWSVFADALSTDVFDEAVLLSDSL